MAVLVLARHGQTEWNKEQRFRGRADVPLDEVGLAEAEALASAFEGMEIGGIYSSPLGRCKQTAGPLAKRLGLDVRVLPGLADIDFGSWQARQKDEIERQEAELYNLWLEHPEQVRFPGGENLEDVQARAMESIDRIVEENSAGAFVAVTHRVVCKVLVCGLLGIPLSLFWRIRQDAACIDVFEIDDKGATLVRLNDTHHTSSVKGSGGLADF
ncbi:MAG: histidine phosphatase family protein [Deltaproteobacteria bacterium]|nr:histidine phosphatase family protein [Deltaproteobacteria bacterium]